MEVASAIRRIKRRVFITKGDELHQLYSFKQEKDGSIYVSSSDFADAKWMNYKDTGIVRLRRTLEAIGEGKITFHPSGTAGIRNNNNPGLLLRIEGSPLEDVAKRSRGARHLFTAFVREPASLPVASPAMNRQNDYVIKSTKALEPFVIMFFAVPIVERPINIQFDFSMHVDDMERIPDDMLGGETLQLTHHNIFWFAYRTKHMSAWPRRSHYSFQDGYEVPVFVGKGQGQLTVEFRRPEYSLEGNNFVIRL